MKRRVDMTAVRTDFHPVCFSQAADPDQFTDTAGPVRVALDKVEYSGIEVRLYFPSRIQVFYASALLSALILVLLPESNPSQPSQRLLPFQRPFCRCRDYSVRTTLKRDELARCWAVTVFTAASPNHTELFSVRIPAISTLGLATCGIPVLRVVRRPLE